ncbi:hypothetical protein [Shouchella lonarensis]|uniref:Uncharacterized protein n=1 Tax=Shouchella lonarensis TaxID=1464122 RepID=A0A1G6MW31_9BACI|nr:hypothetical protein [Shouchella lonarensis]SDC59641.1 hypothetical protein SAMN05421737_11110 [Shouchella lonarensis]
MKHFSLKKLSLKCAVVAVGSALLLGTPSGSQAAGTSVQSAQEVSTKEVKPTATLEEIKAMWRSDVKRYVNRTGGTKDRDKRRLYRRYLSYDHVFGLESCELRDRYHGPVDYIRSPFDLLYTVPHQRDSVTERFLRQAVAHGYAHIHKQYPPEYVEKSLIKTVRRIHEYQLVR